MPQTNAQRHVGLLERRHPALFVAFAVGDVADQQVRDALAVVAAHRAPHLGAVGGGVVAVGERRREPGRRTAPRSISSPIRGPCSGSSSAVCVGWRPVQVGVQAAVEQVHGAQVDRERAFGAPREQLLRDRDGVVVRDERSSAATPSRAHSASHEVGLLVQRVVVLGRLLRGAEAEEVGHQQRVALGERRRDLRPVVRRAREAVQQRHRRAAAERAARRSRARAPPSASVTRSPPAHHCSIALIARAARRRCAVRDRLAHLGGDGRAGDLDRLGAAQRAREHERALERRRSSRTRARASACAAGRHSTRRSVAPSIQPSNTSAHAWRIGSFVLETSSATVAIGQASA